MSDTRQASYDDLPYESHPFPQTHPDRLATLATLLGMQPPSVEHCRVLELGCAGGGNLVPMALGLPQSTFVGVDFSERQIREGQALVQALGLANIELKCLSIQDIEESFGVFDYIVCHGVYSWVSEAEQDKILEICARQLAANGVAYVSYNTYPGWHMRRMVRDMMLYHARRFEAPQMRVSQSRALLELFVQALAQDQKPYSLFLKSEHESLQKRSDSYLFHEHLEESNEPLYFYQFVARAVAKGLRYLGEADVPDMVPTGVRPEVTKALQQLASDDIEMEQYLDFLRNRMFRQTLLCHQHISPHRQLRHELLKGLYVSARVKPGQARGRVGGPGLDGTSAV
jgi:cyclopropane fatty-acyl-phospholipid synthase-like methyltransferase